MANTHNRKDFLKKLGLTLSGAAATVAGFGNYTEDEELIDEQKAFLVEYEAWLKEFQSYIAKRNQNPLDTANNKRLMELSAESEKRKTTLELYMKDPKFADYFNQITKEVTASI
jgi:hypothetical protein